MMYLLDTNVVSELRKVRLGTADAQVAAWAQGVDTADLFISTITVMELELGVVSMERKDPVYGAALRAWLEETEALWTTQLTSLKSYIERGE
ncbi:MAG: hypothetical protein N2690_06440 [Rhodocyclaceae bacterium]|nr:hypothetical protein [Rhodocyclaceae bacterium]